MTTPKDRYRELVNLTQLYLLRECALKERKVVDPAILDYFKKKLSPSPIQHQQPTPPPIRPLPSATTTTAPIFQPKPPSLPLPIQPLPKIEKKREESLIKSPPIEQQKGSPPRQIQKEEILVVSSIEPQPAPEKETKKKGFSLEPMSSPTSQDHSEWWKLYRQIGEDKVLNETIPSDELGQKNKNIWKRQEEIAPIIILSFHDNEQQLTFLKNIAQAISLRLAPAQVISAPHIEKESRWETIFKTPHLQLVISGDYGLYLHPKLMHFYREDSQQNKHFLHTTPLLLLSDLSLYLRDAQLKPLLWRAICNEFAAVQSHRSP